MEYKIIGRATPLQKVRIWRTLVPKFGIGRWLQEGGLAMQAHRLWFFVALNLISLPIAFAQNTTQSSNDNQPHHLIVPLTTRSLAGIVSGDPSKPGAQYVIRMYNDANFIVLPHWHPEDEHITVVKGTLGLGSGDTFDQSSLREMSVGDYVLVPKHMAHCIWSKTATIILIHGIGPFQQINTDAQQSLSGWTIDPEKGLIRDSNSASTCGHERNTFDTEEYAQRAFTNPQGSPKSGQ